MEITGTVRSVKTKEPLGGAKITLSVGTTEMASLYSDGKGYFAHEEATDYIGETLTCAAEKEGFKTKTLTRRIEEQIIPLEIALEEEAVEPISIPKPSILPKILIGAGIGVVVLALVLVGVFVIPKIFGNGKKVEIVSFTAAPSSINKGERSILKWETKNAADATIEPIGIKGKPSAKINVRPDKTTTYTLIARNEEGKEVKREVTVEVEVEAEAEVEIPRPEIVSFKAAPSTIKRRGGRSILTWETKNAAEVKIKPLRKKFRLSGSQEVRPSKTTTYTLMAKDKEGKKVVRRKVTVKVSPGIHVGPHLDPRREVREIPHAVPIIP